MRFGRLKKNAFLLRFSKVGEWFEKPYRFSCSCCHHKQNPVLSVSNGFNSSVYCNLLVVSRFAVSSVKVIILWSNFSASGVAMPLYFCISPKVVRELGSRLNWFPFQCFHRSLCGREIKIRHRCYWKHKECRVFEHSLNLVVFLPSPNGCCPFASMMAMGIFGL